MIITELQEKKRITLDYVPSHKTDGKYAILMETSSEEYESWYYFIRVEGNEENLNHLKQCIESIEWSIMDDCNVFDIELEHLISANTAKELTKVDLNHSSFHRKFDGILKRIDFKFKKKDDDEDKMFKIFNLLGCGGIENFIDDEDLDEEDLATDNGEEDDELGEDLEDDDDDDDDDDEDEDDDDEDEDMGCCDEKKCVKKEYKLPPSLG